MKNYVLFIAINLFLVSSLPAKIINGYASGISTAREAIRKLSALIRLDSNMSVSEKKKLQEYLDRNREFVLYHDLTERLLVQFRAISPEIYYQIDSIKDAKEREVDVYVKFTPSEKMDGSVAGRTNIPMEGGDTYMSSYGQHTASVQVVIGNDALSLLAHEFGHVWYQVPNIATYREFYRKHYLLKTSESEDIGHLNTDLSGQKAFEFQKTYRLKYDSNNWSQKFERPVVVFRKIQKDLFTQLNSPNR